MTDSTVGAARHEAAATALEDCHDRYLDAVVAGDRHSAFAAIEAARGAGVGLHGLYLGVFQPVLREVGRLWQERAMTVAEEHLATAITQSAMVRLYGAHQLPARGQRSLVAACTSEERHEIGLRMVCDFMDMEGWDTRFLGASVPARDLVRMVRDRRPDVLALSASIAPHLPQIGETIRAVRSELGPESPFIVVGGRPFLDAPELSARLGADLTATDAAGAVASLRERFP